MRLIYFLLKLSLSVLCLASSCVLAAPPQSGTTTPAATASQPAPAARVPGSAGIGCRQDEGDELSATFVNLISSSQHSQSRHSGEKRLGHRLLPHRLHRSRPFGGEA